MTRFRYMFAVCLLALGCSDSSSTDSSGQGSATGTAASGTPGTDNVNPVDGSGNGQEPATNDTAPGTTDEPQQQPQAVAATDPQSPEPNSQPEPNPTDPPKEKEKQTPDEVIKAAITQANSEQFAEALVTMEGLLKTHPDHQQALFIAMQIPQVHAMTLAQKGQDQEAMPLFLVSAKYARLLLKHHPDIQGGELTVVANAMYNEACALSRGQKPQEALVALKQAFEHGFDGLELARTDDDLAAIRELPEFADVLKGAEQAIKAHHQKVARDLLAENVTFPFTFTLPGLDSKEVSLDQFQGKVVIADIWGTWCPPCRKEIPHFIQLQESFGDKGLQVIGLNYEGDMKFEEAAAKVKQFWEGNGMNYPCLIGDPETQALVPNFRGFPTTIFIDRSGKVRAKVTGYHPYAKLEAIVTELLAEKPADDKAADKPAVDKPKAPADPGADK